MENESSNVLQIPLEIKLDARGIERRHDFNHLRTWTKVLCRIEAVKSFPCFMKLSFFSPHPEGNEDSSADTNLTIRISIPGLSVQLAASRTKQYSYGLFWKNNRKRCCAFLAFQSRFDFDQHMKWVKYWIECLEYYRKDVLMKRRKSNMNSTMMSSTDRDVVNESLFSQFNSTQNVKDLKEVLGPLPQLPIDLDQDWVRRQSNVSCIYEEIRDCRGKNDLSRASIVSGIYEEMLEDKIKTTTDDNQEVPPLPPRKQRQNKKDISLKRSYTNSEADMIKKKKSWNLQNVVSEFAKRFDSPRKVRKRSIEKSNIDTVTNKASITRRKFKTSLEKSKRSSFSTPDLHHLQDGFINFERGSDNEQDFNYLDVNNPDVFNMSAEFLNISFESIVSDSSLTPDIDEDILSKLNISKTIAANFNVSANSSNVNLVGPYFDIKHHKAGQPKIQEDKVEHIYQVPKNLPIRLIDETTGYCIMGAPVNTNCKTNELDESSHYLKMEDIKAELNEIRNNEPIYANITDTKIDLNNSLQKLPNNIAYRSPRYSVEDRIPSYVPNEDIYQRPRKYSSCSQRIQFSNQEESHVHLGKQKIINELKTGKMNMSYENAMMNQVSVSKVANYCDAHETKSLQSANDIRATITDVVDPRASNKWGMHPFVSLPRMKKIDFSPIRSKITNVFHKYSNGNI